MPSFLRPANLFLLLTYLILSAVPFLPVLFGKPVAQPTHIVAMEFIAWLTIWALFKRPAWFHWLLLPAFLALPTEIYLQMFYGQGISPHHLGIIAETSPRESLEFLGAKIWPMLLIMIAVIAWWWLSWLAARRTRDFDWNDASRWLSLAALAVGAGTWAYGYEFGVAKAATVASAASKAASTAPAASAGFGASDTEEEDAADDNEESDDSGASAVASLKAHASHLPKLPSWARIPFEPEAFGSTWPFGLVIRGYSFWTERQYLADLASKNRLFKFGAHQTSNNNRPQVVVMVIGESGRYDRWSLNGYQRDTNPLLKQEPNLVMLPDLITAVSATRLSVPVILSRKPATQSLQAGFSEKSFLTAFKEAGFKTYWLSNQISFGQFDTPVSVFAKEADVIQFMNLGGFTDNSNLDQILLDPLKNAINDPAPKKLIVLHTLGSHWNYSHRYPKNFDKWQPSLFGVNNPVYTDLKIKPQLNNSYDNSILYTDWFLSQVIGSLKASNQLTSMLYVADHGQTLYDGTCNLAFHGHNTQFEFHVPALMWYSDQYKEAYPDKLAQLQRHRKAHLSTENMFHSLLDMADLHYASERLEWSFLSSQFRRHKRYVDSYGWTNYDKAIIKGDCREVIDKGKPLKQEQ
jgi:glucan phosphoethanolaminetransferase (alkaline phosphatase superfamily)